MRTQEEIVARIEERKANDFLRFEIDEYIRYLDFEHAKAYLKPEATKELWEKYITTKTPKEVMVGYMEFAWEKANNCRGISASRSIAHYIAWLWLDGNEQLARDIEHYEYYGKPELIKICEYLGLDPNIWDNGIREN